MFTDLPNTWQTVEFGSVLDGGTRTGIYKKQEFRGSGMKMVNMGELFAYPRLKDVPMSRIQLNDAETERYSLQVGDLIFARRSLVAEGAGKCSIIYEFKEPLTFESSIIRARPKPDVANSLFLFYLFNSPIGRYLLDTILRQVAVAGITGSDLVKLNIPLPPLSEQRAIAGILGALDDKIELNRRMNRTLESMARAVFQEMMRDESGRMKAGTVGEDFNLTMGQSPPGETYNEGGEGVPFFQGRADFGFRYPENRVYCTAPTRFAKSGDTLVSVRAPVGDVNMAKEECAIGRGVAAVRHKTGSRSYTYYAMKSLEEDFGRFEAEGTVFGSINKADFQNLEIGIPTTEQVEQFEKTCYPMDQMIENNEKESRTLASLRDSLLPKLMRGEVRVK
jgi:type I restriction enzyme S subunit